MTSQEAVVTLIRAARRCPDEQEELLAIAEALAANELRIIAKRDVPQRDVPQQYQAVGIDFPLKISMDTPSGRRAGTLNEDGSVVSDGTRYTSVSRAASNILSYSEDGWRKWRFVDADGIEKKIDILRDRGYFKEKRRRHKGWS
jgi:hypothetical protein